MKKLTRDAILDFSTFSSFAFLVSTGLTLQFFPRGGARIWGLNRHGWTEVHFVVALVFITMVLVHLVQHWRWIVSVARKSAQKRGRRGLVWTIAVLVLVLALAVAPFVSPVEY